MNHKVHSTRPRVGVYNCTSGECRGRPSWRLCLCAHQPQHRTGSQPGRAHWPAAPTTHKPAAGDAALWTCVCAPAAESPSRFLFGAVSNLEGLEHW